jgi:hypothetical protein
MRFNSPYHYFACKSNPKQVEKEGMEKKRKWKAD